MISALFMSILRGAVNALALAARNSQNPYDDVIASFLQDLIKDPAAAGQKLQMFQAMQPHLNDAVAKAAGSGAVGSPGTPGMSREEVEALDPNSDTPRGLKTQDPSKHSS